MAVMIAVTTLFLLLHPGWPRLLGFRIGRMGSEKRLIVGAGWLIGLAFILFVGLYAALVCSGSYDLKDMEPAVTALLLIGTVSFTYSRLFPPQFYAAFLEVTNSETGAWNEQRLKELTIDGGQSIPIFLVIHNAGITAWNNYRITANMSPCVVSNEEDKFPGSENWDWHPLSKLRILPESKSIQLQASNTLAVGEPQTMRFAIGAPSATGDYSVAVSLVADNKLGETRQALKLRVVPRT